MAVPSAVIKKRERLEAEFALMNPPETSPVSGPAPVSEVPPVVAPPPVSAPVTPPQQQVDSTKLQDRIAELEHLLRTRDGQASTSARENNEARLRLDVLMQQVAALEEALTEAQKAKDTAESLATARRADDDMPSLDEVIEVSPEELEKFGGDSVNFVNKLTKRQMLAYFKPLVSKVQAMEKALARLPDLDRVPQLESAVRETQVERQKAKDDLFFREEVLKYFPDFTQTRTSDEWKSYIAIDIPGRGIKIGNLLNTYRLAHDAVNIRSIIQGFYDQSKSRGSLSSLVVPSKTQTEGTPVTKPTFKASQYRDKLRLFTQRRLPSAEWEAFKTEFNTALSEGRVEMDARL